MWFKIFSANKQKEDSAAQEDHAPETPDMEPVPATYDALMRRSRVHRLDIRIDPDSLPRIALIRKPASDEYLPLKHKLVNAALERLRPYLDYCESLPGMSGQSPCSSGKHRSSVFGALLGHAVIGGQSSRLPLGTLPAQSGRGLRRSRTGQRLDAHEYRGHR